jgi:hypothetical protein
MATGRENQLTRQIGEHLVAAELGRRGYVATPFAGNVPLYDLLAANIEGRAIPVQVKAIRGGSWQFSADQFLDIEFANGHQVVRGRRTLLHPELLCIFVLLREDRTDEFYLFQLRDLQDFCERVYRPRGESSRNPDSRHCAVTPKEFKRFRDNWGLLKSLLS